MEYVDNTESPLQYHIWTALLAIAGVLQRKVYIQWNFRRIYPNLFVVFVGPSGCRKGTAMGFGKEILAAVPTVNVIAQKITEEQLIRDMRLARVEFTNMTTGKVEQHCPTTILSEELTVLLGSKNLSLLGTLTDMYDSSDRWVYRTKNKGKDTIMGLNLNFLGATAPDWLQHMIPQAARGGGFASRIIFIVERGKRQAVPFPVMSADAVGMSNDLIHDLVLMNNLSGEYMWMEETKQLYIEWYNKRAMGNPVLESSEFAGYCERRPIHLQKLMMLISASKSNSLYLTPTDFQAAKGILQEAEKTMDQAFSTLERIPMADLVDHIGRLSVRHDTISKRNIVRSLYISADMRTIESAIEILITMDKLKIDSIVGSNVIYRRV